MFNKKNFRRKPGSAEGISELGSADAQAQDPAKPGVLPSAKVAQKKISSRPSLLSFGEDEDEDDGALVLTKPKPKKKLTKGLSQGAGHRIDKSGGPTDKSSMAASNVLPAAGEYTKEKLAALAKSTPRLGVSKQSTGSALAQTLAASSRQPPPPEPVFVLRGSLKPADGGPATSGSQSQVEPQGVSAFSDRLAGVQSTLAGLKSVSSSTGAVGLGVIPDAAAIAAARAKRERLRQAHAAPDYIPVPGGGSRAERGATDEWQTDEGGEGKKETESSEDEDELGGRMALIGLQKAGKRDQKVGMFGGAEVALDEQGGEEEEEEGRRWEEEQLRKAVGGRRVEDAQAEAAATSVQHGGSGVGASWSGGATQAWNGTGTSGFNTATVFGSGRGEVASAVQQAEAVMSYLTQSRQRLKDTHAHTRADLSRTEQSLLLSADSVLSLERTLEDAGRKYRRLQEMKDYVSVLCDLLKDKAPLIEELEEHLLQLRENRVSSLLQRRAEDDADELAEAEAATSAATSTLSVTGSKGAAGIAAAAVAASAAIEVMRQRGGAGGGEDVDEFGRDLGLQKRLAAKRRRDARERRRAAAAEKRKRKQQQQLVVQGGRDERMEDGEKEQDEEANGAWTSEESEGEARGYEEGRREVLATSAAVFRDADDEFGSLRLVRDHFEDFKSEYPQAYRDAYVPLSAPSLFSPYVRLEMLRWDPVFAVGAGGGREGGEGGQGEGGAGGGAEPDVVAGLDSMDWYSLLFNYGMAGEGEEQGAAEDPDADLVPKLVEKVALPLLLHTTLHCFDPLSRTSSNCIATSVQEALIYVDTSAETATKLLSAVREKLEEAAQKIQVPCWAPSVLSCCPEATSFSTRAFFRALRFLRALASWRDILAPPVLDHLALDITLLLKLLPHLRVMLPSLPTSLSRTEAVVGALVDGGWAAGTGGRLPHPLESLTSHTQVICQALEIRWRQQQKGGGRDEGQTIHMARRLKRIMVALGAHDHALHVGKTFDV